MKKILALFAVVSLMLIACSKDDNAGTKPELVFKEYSVPFIVDTLMDQFNVTFQIRDGDGDIESFFYFQTVIDSRPETDTSTVYEPRQIPSIGVHAGRKLDAELIYTMLGVDFKTYDNFTKPDSLRIRAFVVDKAGNSSDTIITPKLAIIKE